MRYDHFLEFISYPFHNHSHILLKKRSSDGPEGPFLTQNQKIGQSEPFLLKGNF